MKKISKYSIPVAAFAAGLVIAGSVAAQAATTTTTTGAKTNPMSGLVAAIAQKFNLNTTDVQQVFDDQRTQMEAERAQHETDRLNQAVTDGKLTQDQADKIVAKQKELEAQREANKSSMEGKTEEERHTAMEAEITALKQWATDNSIPQEFMPFGGHGGPGGRGGFGHRGPKDATQSSSTNN